MPLLNRITEVEFICIKMYIQYNIIIIILSIVA